MLPPLVYISERANAHIHIYTQTEAIAHPHPLERDAAWQRVCECCESQRGEREVEGGKEREERENGVYITVAIRRTRVARVRADYIEEERVEKEEVDGSGWERVEDFRFICGRMGILLDERSF